MKRIVLIILFFMAVACPKPTHSEEAHNAEDSNELKYQDMLMLFLHAPIEQAVYDYYSQILTENPLVYPYQVEKVERVGGNRTFHFLISLIISPVVGPHISVGKDRLTFELAPNIPNQVKLLSFEHLESHPLPPHWQHIKQLGAHK